MSIEEEGGSSNVNKLIEVPQVTPITPVVPLQYHGWAIVDIPSEQGVKTSILPPSYENKPLIKGTSKLYRVQPGDTLAKIARMFYGSSDSWPKIYMANQDTLSNPHVLVPGMYLRIP